LKRTIQRMVENPLAVELLAGRFTEGDHVIVEVEPRRRDPCLPQEARVVQPA
jgi:ATP-dependent Clp protease ATP-binding subunit ClpA